MDLEPQIFARGKENSGLDSFTGFNKWNCRHPFGLSESRSWREFSSENHRCFPEASWVRVVRTVPAKRKERKRLFGEIQNERKGNGKNITMLLKSFQFFHLLQNH